MSTAGQGVPARPDGGRRPTGDRRRRREGHAAVVAPAVRTSRVTALSRPDQAGRAVDVQQDVVAGRGGQGMAGRQPRVQCGQPAFVGGDDPVDGDDPGGVCLVGGDPPAADVGPVIVVASSAGWRSSTA